MFKFLRDLTLKAIASYIVMFFICGFVATAGILLATKLIGNPFSKMSLKLSNPDVKNSMTVDGSATIETVPDQAEVSLGITVQQSTVATAQEKVNQTILNIQNELKELGIDAKQIKTANYSVYPNYDYSGSTQRVTGYTVSQNLNITIKNFDLLNQVVDLATQNGANQVGGISFSLSEEKKKDLQEQARHIAIEEAKQKATNLAEDAGVKLGSIIGLWEDTAHYDYAPYERASVMTMNQSLAMEDNAKEINLAGTSIEAGSTNYTYSISLTYEIE